MVILTILALALTPPADIAEVQLHVQSAGTQQDSMNNVWGPLSEGGWVGNCVAFALEKRKELIAEGYDPKRLVVWIAREDAPSRAVSAGPLADLFANKGNTHAVLVVDRRWVLDNLVDAVEPMGRQHADLVCPATDLSPQVRNDNDLGRCR